MIAIHTALSVLRPGKVTLDSGLYRFRYQAYACWAVFAILLAALAFAGASGSAYVFQGTYCFLPARPIWYRIALSWGPRYFILITILLIYLWIYLYAKAKFGSFNPSLSSEGTSTTEQGVSNTSDDTPKVEARGLENYQGRANSHEQEQCGEVGTASSPTRLTMTQEPSWVKDSFSRSECPTQAVARESNGPEGSNLYSLTDTSIGRSPPDPKWENGTSQNPTLFKALRDKSLSALALKRPLKNPNESLHKRHKEIQRQLRYMFVYPMIYLVMWTPPFVNHCYYYTKTHRPPIYLNTFSLIFLLLQCTVDCIVFCTREKPWRYTAKAEARTRSQRFSGKSANGIEMRRLTVGGGALAQDQATASNDSHALKPLKAQSPRRERFWWDDQEY